MFCARQDSVLGTRIRVVDCHCPIRRVAELVTRYGSKKKSPRNKYLVHSLAQQTNNLTQTFSLSSPHKPNYPGRSDHQIYPPTKHQTTKKQKAATRNNKEEGRREGGGRNNAGTNEGTNETENKRTKNKEQRTKNKEQRTKNKEQRRTDQGVIPSDRRYYPLDGRTINQSTNAAPTNQRRNEGTTGGRSDEGTNELFPHSHHSRSPRHPAHAHTVSE